LAGWVFDTTGSYQVIWSAFIAVSVLMATIAATMPPPPTQARSIDRT